MPSSENGNRVPNSAMRFDVQPSARDVAEIFLVLVFWAVIGYGTLLYLLLAPITRHLQFPSWTLYLCFVFPALSRVYTLATLFWKSGANSRKVFVDEKGVYVEEKKGAVCAYMWDSLEGFCFTRMSSIHKGFNVISLFRSPSMNLNFEGGKQVEIYNVFCGRQNLVFVDHIFYELYKSSRGNTVLKTRILEAYPLLEADVLNWSGLISEEPMGGDGKEIRGDGAVYAAKPVRLDLDQGLVKCVQIIALYGVVAFLYSAGSLYCITQLFTPQVNCVWVLIVGILLLYPVGILMRMINLYLAEGPGRLKLFVDSNGIYAYRKNGTIETYLWKDLVEIRTHAIWRGWRDILAVIFFFPPSVDVVFRDCRSLPIYNVFNGVECMAISGVMEGFSIFPKLYRLSENSELVLDKIVRIAPRLKFGLNRAD